MSLPEFKDRLSSFTVTFPNHSLMSHRVVEWLSSLGEEGLSDSQCTALALMREGQELDKVKSAGVVYEVDPSVGRVVRL
jgi:ATP-dependent DNA helicase RecG